MAHELTITEEPGYLHFRVRGENTPQTVRAYLQEVRAACFERGCSAILVEEDRILFAGDAFMPLPYLVDGNIDDMMASIKKIGRMGLENIVQGHGDIILRGEIDAAVKENLAYLSAIRKAVRAALKRKAPLEYLEEVGIEECGKSRVYLGGLAEALHRRNLRALYKHMLENSDSLEGDD